jgi:hypothetical protein
LREEITNDATGSFSLDVFGDLPEEE